MCPSPCCAAHTGLWLGGWQACFVCSKQLLDGTSKVFKRGGLFVCAEHRASPLDDEAQKRMTEMLKVQAEKKKAERRQVGCRSRSGSSSSKSAASVGRLVLGSWRRWGARRPCGSSGVRIWVLVLLIHLAQHIDRLRVPHLTVRFPMWSFW